jgi:hypothetical protein
LPWAQPGSSGNSRHAGQLTDHENTNIIIAAHPRFRRLCLRFLLT